MLYTLKLIAYNDLMVELKLKCGFSFPFLSKAIQILQSILPEGNLSPEEELVFVLRAFGKAITGQNIQIEKVLANEDYSFTALLDRGNSMALKDKFSRKQVAVNKFNNWLKEHEFLIIIEPNAEYIT